MEVGDEVSSRGKYFFADTLDEVQEILKEYFKETNSRFVVQKRTQKYGTTGKLKEKIFL